MAGFGLGTFGGGDDSALLGGEGSWQRALAIIGATLQDIGAAQQGRVGGALNSLGQRDEAARKRKQQERRQSAQAALLGGYDPTTDVTWNTGRQGMTPEEERALLAQAFPDEVARARVAQLLPPPSDWVGMGGGAATGGLIGNAGMIPAGAPAAAPPSPAAAAPPLLGTVPPIYQPYVEDAAGAYGVAPWLLGNMLVAESGGDATAVSPAGARGLMQFMPGTARQYGVDVADPQSSIDGAGRYMRDLSQKYGGDERLAVMAYNWGPGNVDKWLAGDADPAKVPAETRNYVARVLGGGGQRVQRADAAIVAPAAPAGPGLRVMQNRKTGEVRYMDGQGMPLPEPPSGYRYTRDGQLEAIAGGPHAESGGLFSGNSVDGQALNQLVERGLLTPEQALTWAAGRTVMGPNGQVDFLTPQAVGQGQPQAGAASAPAPAKTWAPTPAQAPTPAATPSGVTNVRPAYLAPAEKEAIMEADRAAEASESAATALREALKLNDKAFDGSKAAWMPFVDRNLLPGDWGGKETTELENIVINQALTQMRSIFGANPTEGERKILLDLQGAVTLSADERAALFRRAIEQAEKRSQRERGRAEALRSGTYYTQGMPAPAPGPRVLRFDAEGNPVQ